MVTAAVLALGRPTFDLDAGAHCVESAVGVLDRIGVDTPAEIPMLTTPDQFRAAISAVDEPVPDVVVVLQATFTDATPYIELAVATDAPILVWSFPEARTGGRLRLNSLCGANLAAYSLRRRNRRCDFVHLDPDRCDAADRVRSAINSVMELRRDDAEIDTSTVQAPIRPATVQREVERVADVVASATIGVIGDPPDGFEPCVGDDVAIADVFGATVEHLPIEDLFSTARDTTDEQRVAIRKRIDTVLDVDPAADGNGLNESICLYRAAHDITATRGWSAVASRCWPECMADFGGAMCTPHAMLTEDGTPGVCEADLFGAITAVMLQSVSGSDPFIADLVDVDEADDTSVLWHCGVASTTLADPDVRPVGTLHQNRHRSLVNEFALKPGVVTVARLSQAGGELSLVIGGGEMLPRPRAFSGTSGTIRWSLPARDVLRTVLDCGVEHHLGVVYGEHRDVLVALAERWGLPVIRLGHEPNQNPVATG